MRVLFALGVDPSARDVMKVGVLTSESRKLHPLQCHARLVFIHVPLLHKSSIASLARRQANTLEFVTKFAPCSSCDLLSVQIYIRK